MRRILLAGVLAITACQDGGPSLSQTSQLAVVLSPPSTATNPTNFGAVQVGQTSASASINVNPGPGEVHHTISAITESCPDFEVSAPGLPADVYRICYYDDSCDPKYEVCPVTRALCQTLDSQSYTFSAVFKPTVAGNSSCVATIVMDGGAYTRAVTFAGTGTVPPIDIDVQPTNVPFGDVRRNTASDTVTVTVRNVGGSTMTVSSVSISSGFTIMSGPTGSYAIAASGQQAYGITCNPTTTGTMSGNLTINSNDPSTPTVNVGLSCRGIDSALALAPSPATLNTTRVGEPVQANITIANSGTASMQLQSVALSGTDLQLMSAPNAGTLPAGASGIATVRFMATEKGTQTGTLTVTYDGGQTRTSQVTARALATSMALSPDGDVDFGPVCAGQTKTQMFSVIANDEGPFRINTLGGIAAPFTVQAPTLPANVTGNGANTVTFTVTAGPQDAGVQQSSLELVTDIPGASPRTINLSVDALPAGVSPSPVSLDFGSTPEMTTTIGQSVHLSNCSTAPVTFTNARIEGTDANDFAIVATPQNTTISPAANASWLVVLSAKSVGLKSADFVVDYDGGTARVALAGEGLGELPDPTEPTNPLGDEELSYYSCSVGGSPGAAWPLGLGLALVLFRRRRRS